MTESKSATERVAALRQRRAELGLQRLELYVHPDDREQVQKFARRLQRRRERQASRPSEG
jgi:hypothetical protein